MFDRVKLQFWVLKYFGLEHRKNIPRVQFVLQFYDIQNDMPHNMDTFKVLDYTQQLFKGWG